MNIEISYKFSLYDVIFLVQTFGTKQNGPRQIYHIMCFFIHFYVCFLRGDPTLQVPFLNLVRQSLTLTLPKISMKTHMKKSTKNVMW